MRAFLPLCLLMLAACDPPLEEVFPARFYSFDHNGLTYEARAQFDPFKHGWSVRMTSIQHPLEPRDMEFAVALAENELGPQLCGGNALEVETGEAWGAMAGRQILYLDGPETFMFVGSCTSAPPEPGIVVVRADAPVLITIED